ncbi:hypothetical protein [Micromonospora sp. CA-244673]
MDHVNADHLLGIQGAQPTGDHAADIPTEGTVMLVAKDFGHQQVQRLRH